MFQNIKIELKKCLQNNINHEHKSHYKTYTGEQMIENYDTQFRIFLKP